MTSKQDQLKRAAAEKALEYVEPGSIIGVGTGSTVNYFVEALAKHRCEIEFAVSSSEETTRRLHAVGIATEDLNAVSSIPLYVDGADEANELLQLIKGGGGALTREKLIAAVSRKFVCIVDSSKCVRQLGTFPLPVEVLPMARSYVAREIVKLGGDPVYREGFLTDNGNVILDVHNLTIEKPIELESQLNQVTGVVTNGLFAARPADELVIASDKGIEVRQLV